MKTRPVSFLKTLLDVLEQRQSEIGEGCGAHVLHRQVHRLPDLFGDVGRSGNEKMGETGHVANSS